MSPEAVKLAQSVLEGAEAVEWISDEASRLFRFCPDCYEGPLEGHASDCKLATALTSARALLALLEKEAGGEGEGELRVEGWIAEDDGWMLASGQGYCVEFDPMPSTEFKKPARATLVVHPRTPPEQPARDPRPVSSGQDKEAEAVAWAEENILAGAAAVYAAPQPSPLSWEEAYELVRDALRAAYHNGAPRIAVEETIKILSALGFSHPSQPKP